MIITYFDAKVLFLLFQTKKNVLKSVKSKNKLFISVHFDGMPIFILKINHLK